LSDEAASKAPPPLKVLPILRKAWPYVRPYRAGVALAAATLLLSVFFSLLRPWPMKVLVDEVLAPPPGAAPSIYDRMLPEAPRRRLVAVLGALLVVNGCASALDLLHRQVRATLGARCVLDLRARLFAHLVRLSLGYHDRQRVGDTVYRLTANTSSLWSLIEHLAFSPISSIVTLVGAVGLMLSLDVTLTLVALAVVPLLSVSIRWYTRRAGALSRMLNEREGMVSAYSTQALTAIRLVQSFAREDLEDARFRDHLGKSLEARLAEVRLYNFYNLILSVILGLATLALVAMGAWRVLDGELTVGDLLVFGAYLGSIFQPLSALSQLGGSVIGAATGLERVLEVLGAPREVDDRPGAAPLDRAAVRGRIEVRGARFAYDGQKSALNDVDLDVRPGEVVAIVGPTGAGKSTLVSLVPRFYDPDEGTVRLDGRDVRDIALRSLREHVAIVPQDTILFAASVRENIAYGRPGATDAEIEAAARAAQADDFIRRLPAGYDTEVGERGVRLSAGERQRIAIARAFLKDAPILVLDEPTSALDVATEAALLESLGRLMAGRTTLVITHRLALARRATRVVFVEAGRIVEQGPPEELLARGEASAFARFVRAEQSEAQGLP
jgi:ABC-type multidrug transport system fused ATPase/permease subunit